MVEDSYNTQPVPEEEGAETGSDVMPEPEPAEPPVEDNATVDIITGERKVTMSATVKEFEEFKDSFKAMMVAFGNFIEAAGLEIGKNETDSKGNALAIDMEKLRDDLSAEQEKIREQLVSKDEFEGYKNDSQEKAAKESEDYVRRTEFDRFREAIKEVL